MLAILLAVPSFAAGLEGTFELASLQASDPGYPILASALPSFGGRIGLDLGKNVAVLGGWHHVSRGDDVSFSGTYNTVRMAMRVEEFTLGARFGLPIGDYFTPYASVEGLVADATLLLDDDPSDPRNADHVASHTVAPGGFLMGGFEVHGKPYERVSMMLTAHLEAGYGLVAPLDFHDQGTIGVGGLALRGGVGVRF